VQLDSIRQEGLALLYMERYVDEGTRTYSPFAAKSEVAPEYRPQGGRPSFELITVFAAESQVEIFQADPHRSLRDFYVRSGEVRFLIHPETWKSPGIDHLEELHGLRRGEPIEVAPTASTRTVLTKETRANVPPHFIKLHYPRRISRFNRRLRRKNIRNSVEATHDLERVSFEKFAYLADCLGITYGDGGNPWGFLVREATPRPFRRNRFLVPYFAFVGRHLIKRWFLGIPTSD
jgi:hypothetical protein